MMASPEPLTSPDCNLQDFQFMPLDVLRLRDSELASNETPEACWAAVLLWCAAWHQVPAGSIPNDEQWIAKQAGYARRGRIDKEWADVRPGALRGWVECSDGRLYHPVVAEKARDAWQSKLEQRWRSECGRVKKHNQRHGTKLSVPDFVTWLSLGCPQGQPLYVPRDIEVQLRGQGTDVPDSGGTSPEDNQGDKGSKGQGDGQGQRDSSEEPSGSSGAAAPPKQPEQMTKDELWAAGKSLLSQAGMPAAQCGSFVGKLVKDYGPDVVVEAVRSAVLERPADPASFLKAACQHRVGQRQTPNRQEALEARNREVARRLAAGESP